MTETDSELLNDATVIDYLRGHSLLTNAPATAIELGGGVSNIVLSVHQGHTSLVVKQSLPRLRVATEWLAPVSRVITEATAMKLVGKLVPDATPTIRLTDADRFIIAMDHAPAGWTDWKSELLQGRINAAAASQLGELIGKIHQQTTSAEKLPKPILDPSPFEQLRLQPYYETTAQRLPQHAPRIRELAEALRGNRSCLIHGDLSPKNILVEPHLEKRDVLIIDFEVATYGDPAFDLAFLLTHLTMKSLHRPQDRAGYDLAAVNFIAAYEANTGALFQPDWSYVISQVGALLLARVYGKSPAEYLSSETRRHCEALAARLLPGDIHDINELHAEREAVIA